MRLSTRLVQRVPAPRRVAALQPALAIFAGVERAQRRLLALVGRDCAQQRAAVAQDAVVLVVPVPRAQPGQVVLRIAAQTYNLLGLGPTPNLSWGLAKLLGPLTDAAPLIQGQN